MLPGKKIRLRPKQIEDALNDYSWRVDPELARLDAATPLTCSFEEYRAGYDQELLYSPNQHYCFAIETPEGKHIGNCLCFGVDKVRKQAEMGIVIGDRDCWNKGYGPDAIITLLNHIFAETDLERIYLKTLEWNTRAQKCFAKCGFLPCGHLVNSGHKFILMEVRCQQWPHLQP